MRFYRYRLATLVVIAALTGVIFNAVQNSGPALGYPSATVVATLSAPQITHRLYLPLVQKNYPAPPPAPSCYLVDASTIRSKGAELGQHALNTPGTQEYLVILVYGYPAQNTSTGEYGALYTFEPATFVSQADIINSANDFARDFYYATGSDNTSQLKLVLGVNNCSVVGLSIWRGHGAAWGYAVDAVRNVMSGCCSSQVTVVGGLDAEPAWTRPYRSTQWLDRYMTTTNCEPDPSGNHGCLYNYGNISISMTGDTCATTDTQTVWTGCDVWYLSWGALKNGRRFPRALPEIYHTVSSQPPYGTDATAWRSLSIYSIERKVAGPVWFVGSLTQFARCGSICDDGGGPYGNNTPQQGWSLLMDALGSDSRASQSVSWSTDIRIQP